jgi:hypothetical protein
MKFHVTCIKYDEDYEEIDRKIDTEIEAKTYEDAEQIGWEWLMEALDYEEEEALKYHTYAETVFIEAE